MKILKKDSNLDLFNSENKIEIAPGSEKKETKNFRGKIEDYRFLKEIGKGAYAIVKSAYHKSTGIKYAIKIYEKYKLVDPAKNSAVKREIQILKNINHKNIVGLFEVIETPKQVIFKLFIIKIIIDLFSFGFYRRRVFIKFR